MNMRVTVFLAAGTAVILCGALLASAAEPSVGQNQSPMRASTGIIRNSTLIGTTVLDPQSHALGQIKDVVFDSQTGQATFIVLDAKTADSGQGMLVVPLQALRLSTNPKDNRQTAVLDLSGDQLRAAPKIQNNQWQMLQDRKFLEQARAFYQPRTYTAARPIDEATPPPNPPSAPSVRSNVQSAPPCLCLPAPCFIAPPCCGCGCDWPQSLVDFSSE